MIKKYFQCVILFVVSSIAYSQNATLCPSIADYIRIEDVSNVPVVTDNGDGTISLTHPEQYITDIFAGHVIYGFVQTFPNSSETLEKYYTLFYDEKDLILELNELVSSDIFSVDIEYEYTPINTELIDFLDEKQFRLTHFCSIADNFGEPCPELSVPDEVFISVTFNYDAITDMMLMESYGLTACGNSFSIALRGGTEPNTLQLWKSVPGVITVTDYETNTCHMIEDHLYSMLDISCSDINIGNIIPTIDLENNTLFLYRQNMVFGYHTATFLEENLSVAEQTFKNLRLFQLEGNPYLQISNVDSPLYVEVTAMTGSIVLKRTRFETNKILIDYFSNGLYVIKVSNDRGDYKTFKFLKR